MRDKALTLLGLMVTATPLALWVAWSQAVFVIVLAGCIGALALVCVLAVGEEDAPGRGPARTLSNESLAQLSALGPFTYHHRRSGARRFQEGMRSLKRASRID